MPIQILPARLANQIAAGEVVERPASVVKELVENSLDAGANRVEIDIEKGGSRLIRIRDNGSGIRKDELGLALSRHATSKIATLDDLEAIDSLGFRGEALASISSVSRLTLTSRTADQTEAWTAYAEGRDMNVQLKPAAHPVGTTLEVHDLFFNTPARRKFLRTDKTEFGHIDELLKRIALSRFDTTIILRHNGKVVRQYRPASTDSQTERRLAAVCGSPFLQHALEVEMAHGDLKLRGWVCSPEGARSQNDIQYCYVNGRMMKDKLINHAIRQGYENRLQGDQYAAYVLFIEVDAHQVDVNVHPAKHEVRFHQARLVHDFIFQTVFDALNQGELLPSSSEAIHSPQSAQHQEAVSFPSSPTQEGHADDVFVGNRHSSDAKASDVHTGGNQNRSAYVDAVASVPSYPSQAPASSWREQFPKQSAHSGSSREPSSPRKNEVNEPYRGKEYGAASPSPRATAAYQALMSTGSAVEGASDTQQVPHTSIPTEEIQAATSESTGRGAQGIGKVVSVIEGKYLLVEQGAGLCLASIERLRYLQVRGQLQLASTEGLKPQPLLIPLVLSVDSSLINIATSTQTVLQQLGVILQVKGKQQLMVMAVSLPMRQQNLQVFIPKLLKILTEDAESMQETLLDNVAKALLGTAEPYSLSQGIALVTEVEQLWALKLERYLPFLLQAIDLAAAKQAFE